MKRRDFIKTSLTMGAAASIPGWMTALPGGGRGTPIAAHRSIVVSRQRGPMFFLPERIAALKREIAERPEVQARWKQLLQLVDELTAGLRQTLGEPFGPVALALGLAWQITEQPRYAKKLREILLKSVEADGWGVHEVSGHSPPWHSSLATASATVNGAIGREALEGYWSPGDRQAVTDGMMRLGVLPLLDDWILPAVRIHALDSMGHNWWSVCISGAGVGALAMIGEDDRAPAWLQAIETALAGFFEYRGNVLQNKTANFDPRGAFYESVHYAGYALVSYLTFRLARTNAMQGEPPPAPVLDRMDGFFVHTLYPAKAGDLAVNFGDSTPKPNAGPTLRLLRWLGMAGDGANWYLGRQPQEPVSPLSFLCPVAGRAEIPASLPDSIMYPSTGWAVLRSSWEEDATMLSMKSGFTWNHAHADAGSFMLYHAGQPLIVDSGTCAYSRKEYLDYYCQSRAHNVVLFNGQGQPTEDFHERGVKFPGRIHDLLDGDGVKYIYADATGPMARYFSRNYRHWVWIDGVILIFDDLLAHEAGRFDWLLHYAGSAQATATGAVLANGRAGATIAFLHPEGLQISQPAGLAENDPDTQVTYLQYSTTTRAREQKFAVAILPAGPDPCPQVKKLEGADIVGVRIRSAAQVTDVYLNVLADGRRMNANSNNVIDGWETDAYLLGLTRPADAASDCEHTTRYLMAGCSYLRRSGQLVWDSFSKASAIFSPGDTASIRLLGQAEIRASLLSLHRPAALKVNGKGTHFEFDPSNHVLSFQAGRA